MKRFAIALLALIALAAPASADYLAPGFTMTTLSSEPFAYSPGLGLVEAPNGDVRVSDSQRIGRLVDGAITWESIIQSGGGPLSNTSGTTTLAIDSQGREYIADFNNGRIYRRTGGGAWTLFGYGPQHARDMRFDGGENLIVLAGSTDLSSSSLWSITPSAVGTRFANNLPRAESFAIDGGGNYILPQEFGEAIYRVSPTGSIESIWGNLNTGRVESLAITSGGKLLVGTWTGTQDPGARSEIRRLDLDTGVDELIWRHLLADTNQRIPVDLEMGDEMRVALFGSVETATLAGDFDAPLVPEPASLTLASMALALMARRPARKPYGKLQRQL